MSKIKKIIEKFLKQENNFEYQDLVAMLNYYGFKETKMGKTTGSAVCFVNEKTGAKIRFHKPHPDNCIKKYLMKQIKQELEKEGVL